MPTLLPKIGSFFLFLVFIVSFSYLDAQTIHITQPSRVKHISSDSGLSQVTISALVKDNKGFIWIGTQDGLNRYDGTNIIQFKNNPKDKNSISGNFITSLFFGRSEKIWVGTSNHGLCYYNSSTGFFAKPTVKEVFSEIITNSTITHINQDHLGYIWINVLDRGVYRLKPTSGDFFECIHIPIYSTNLVPSSLYISSDNIIWIGTENSQIFHARIDTETPLFTAFTQSRSTGRITRFIDNKQYLWVGTSKGLWRIDKNEKKVSFYNLISGKSKKTKEYGVTALEFNSNNELWVGTGNGLFNIKNINQNNFPESIISYNENTNAPISHNTVFSLLHDNNLLWIGTALNLDIFDFSFPKFKNLKFNPENGLDNSVVLAIYKSKGDIWIGTAGGLNLFKNGKKYHFKENPFQPNSLADDIVKSITPDHNGYLWFGTTKGVSVINLKEFNPDNPHFISFYSELNNTTTLSGDNTRTVFLDNNNNIWITTYSNGINRFVGSIKNQDFSFQQFKHDKTNPNSISSNFVHCMNQDSDGKYWIGTHDGLDKISFLSNDFSKLKVEKYTHNPNNLQTLSSNSIKEIYFDTEGTMWIATRNGFNKFNKENDTFQSFYTTDGLPNNFIYSIQDDDFGHLWLGTNKGLVCFNKVDGNITNFSKDDGIANDEFNSLANFKDSNGVIYMGNIKGVTSFYPPNVLEKKNPVDVIFSEILLPNKQKKKGRIRINRNMKSIDASSKQAFVIGYSDFPLYLRFSSPRSGPFEKPDYYYKLVPTDNDWNYLGDRKEIQFLNLSAGSYSVMLAGGQDGEIWKNSVCKLDLKITPPWWKSFFAYLSYILLSGVLFFSIIRLYYRRKMVLQETLRIKDLEQSKAQFYTNITHEFRTPLSVILGMVEELNLKSISKDSHILPKATELIKRNAIQLLNLVNQLLDMTKLRKGQYKLALKQSDIIPFVQYTINNLHSFAKVHDVSLVDYIEETKLVMDFDVKAMERILTNLLSNAIKFSKKGENVVIHLHKDVVTKNLIISIIDKGIGIDENELTKIFERFYQTNSYQSDLKNGTGIGLALVKDLIKLHKGSITVNSKIGLGSTFTIHIPITNRAPLQIQDEVVTLEVNQTIISPITKLGSNKFLEDDKEYILIVEDNRDIATYISLCLKNKYHIQYAENGKIGLEMALQTIPDLIISDIMMPELDGYELCDILKNDVHTSHIPIVLLTGKSEQKDKIIGLSKGVDVYLTKPFDKEELLIRIEELIKLRNKLQIHYTSQLSIDSPDKNKETRETLFLKKVMEIIEKDITNSNLNAKYIALEIGMSESLLYRKLKALSGKSIAVFIRYIRLKSAKQLLETTDKSISEIAYDCGFNDPAWFSKTFKEEYGLAPSTLRS